MRAGKVIDSDNTTIHFVYFGHRRPTYDNFLSLHFGSSYSTN